MENSEAIDGRGFNAQDEPAKRYGQRAERPDRVHFRGSKIAFRADPDTSRLRLAAVLRLKGAKVAPGRAAAGLQACDQRQLKGLLPCEELFGRNWRFDSWQPARAALLDGFDGDQLQFRSLARGVFLIELRDHAFGQQGHNPGHPQFSRLLDDAFDDFALGQRLD